MPFCFFIGHRNAPEALSPLLAEAVERHTPFGLRLGYYCHFSLFREPPFPTRMEVFLMIIKYKFATGEVTEVEVSDEIGTVILDSRREEHANNERHRYSCSLK